LALRAIRQAGEFTDAEREAREKRRGLWADPHPVPPWEYRREHRRAARPALTMTFAKKPIAAEHTLTIVGRRPFLSRMAEW
jgi:hypothetical protein